MTELDAVYAFVAAFAVAAVLTPLTARFARRVGAVDQPKARGLGRESTPLLGGLAIFAGALVAGAAVHRDPPAPTTASSGILAARR